MNTWSCVQILLPKQIMENLENDKDIKEVPLFRDLYNYLARYKKNTLVMKKDQK